MSYNGSGTFLINTAGQPVVSGTVISSTAFNALTADLATGLSTAITKDGQTTVTANIPMGTYKFTGLGAGTAATDSANLSQVQSTVTKLLASVSGADTITAVGSPTLGAYAAGQMFYFVAASANTGAVTINIDSLGAKSITRDGTTALAAGDIQSGEVCVIVYDGTQFQLVNGASQSASIVTENLTVNKATVLNESGGDNDTRIEGDTDANLVFVDASTDRVGVGTNTPSAKFNIFGISNAVGLGLTGTHSAGDTAISISPSSSITGSYNSIYSYPSASTGVGYTFGNSNSSSSSANSRVDILVGGANGGDPKITYTVSGVINWSIGVDNSDSDALKISTSDAPGTSDRFIIGTSGVINSYATSGTGAQFSLYSNGQTTIPVTLAQGFATATDNIAYLFNRANAAFVFGTNNTERARILSTGELLVNATSQPGAYKLYTSGTDAFHAHTTETGGGGTPINVTRAGTSGTANLVLFASGGSGVGSISTNGTTTSYNTSSDRRLKENIVPADDAGDVIDAIEVVKHDWKNGGHVRYGVIAQDLHDVVPEAVTVGDPEDAETLKNPWSVDYSKLVPMLIKEVQSLRKRVAELEAK